MNTQLEAPHKTVGNARPPRGAAFVPLVWIAMLGAAVLVQVSLWAVAALCIAWVVVFFFYGQRLMALATGVFGALIAIGLLLFTVPLNR